MHHQLTFVHPKASIILRSNRSGSPLTASGTPRTVRADSDQTRAYLQGTESQSVRLCVGITPLKHTQVSWPSAPTAHGCPNGRDARIRWEKSAASSAARAEASIHERRRSSA